jgi:hypothetical protein
MSMSNKIVLVLTEEELKVAQYHIHEVYGCLCNKPDQDRYLSLDNKLNSAKDKSFNFLYELAEIERIHKEEMDGTASFGSIVDLVNKFIQGE